jgi:1,4-dihydroxy-2-naphthoyl-CoA synthase
MNRDVRLNDPDRLNALTFQTYEELERLFAEQPHDKQVKVVIITGTNKILLRRERARDYRKLIDMSADDPIDSHK